MRFSISQLLAPFESKLFSHSSFGSDFQRERSEGQPDHVGISLGQVRGTAGHKWTLCPSELRRTPEISPHESRYVASFKQRNN